MTTDAVIPTLTVRTAGLAAVFDPGDSKAWACGGFRTAWPLGMGILSPEPQRADLKTGKMRARPG